MNVDFSVPHALPRMEPMVLVMAGSALLVNHIDRTALGFEDRVLLCDTGWP